jgi:nicotinate-nucleotide adenylyltransferase
MGAGIGLFGGTFNPVHIGHLIIARAALEHLGLERMVLIPSANPPHKGPQGVADAEDRLAMLRLAVADEADFDVSACEIERPGPSYTIDTVAFFRKELGDRAELYWLIGADSLSELASWHRVVELVGMCQIVTAARPGWESPDLSALTERVGERQVRRLRDGILPTPRIDISASEIRRRVRQGRSVRWLVPMAVAQYIDRLGLYRE